MLHDEAAYLLQAELFASARWTAAGRPLPEFFQQYHVLVTPVLASKYPPGHSLALTPGTALGMPWLMPLIFAGLTGSLTYALARDLSGWRVGLLAWAFWLVAPMNLRFRPSFLSEVTSSLAVVASWYACWQWSRTGRAGWMAMWFVILAWCAITRPLTAVAFALPMLPLLWRAVKDHSGNVLVAGTCGLVVVTLLPLWSLRTTGNVGRTPLAAYTDAYMPWDRVGFGLNDTEATIPLSGQRDREFARGFKMLHRQHTVGHLPATIALRLRSIGEGAWGMVALPLFFAALLGLLRMPRAALIPAVGALALVLLYSSYAHAPEWSVYYVELLPLTAYLAALGVTRLRDAIPRIRLVLIIVVLPVWVGVSAQGALKAREGHRRTQEPFLQLESRLAGLGSEDAIVFVRPALWDDVHVSLVRNHPDLTDPGPWLVHDLGHHNDVLLGGQPERKAFIYLGGSGSLVPYPGDSHASGR